MLCCGQPSGMNYSNNAESTLCTCVDRRLLLETGCSCYERESVNMRPLLGCFRHYYGTSKSTMHTRSVHCCYNLHTQQEATTIAAMLGQQPPSNSQGLLHEALNISCDQHSLLDLFLSFRHSVCNGKHNQDRCQPPAAGQKHDVGTDNKQMRAWAAWWQATV